MMLDLGHALGALAAGAPAWLARTTSLTGVAPHREHQHRAGNTSRPPLHLVSVATSKRRVGHAPMSGCCTNPLGNSNNDVL
jgi:hypothetical protein